METKKNSKFYIVFGLILFASFGFIAIATMDYQSYHEVSYPNNNLALPDLNGKTEITHDVIRLYDSNGITIDYNINNGNYILNGTSNDSMFLYLTQLPIIQSLQNITRSIYYVSGTQNTTTSFAWSMEMTDISKNEIFINSNNINQNATTSANIDGHRLRFYVFGNRTFNDYTFKLQLSKGSYVLPYVVPKETIIYAHNQDYTALTEIGSVAITSLTGFINGFKVVGDILQTLVQFQQTVVYEVSKFLIENYIKVIDFLESITDNGLIEWIKDPMKGFKF